LFGKSIPAYLREAAGLEDTKIAAGRYRALGNKPILVLSRQMPAAVVQTSAMLRTREEVWAALQVDLASWSTASELRVVPDSFHNLDAEHPEAVVQAVKDVMKKL
jgi:pimeloyl-ACP methyl ester carboxylesterase